MTSEMTRFVTVAAIQMGCCSNRNENLDKAVALVRDASSKGANIVLLQELFADLYFCQEQLGCYFDYAEEESTSLILQRFQALSKELGIVLPISFFERSNNVYFNSIVVFDSNGNNLGKYRKSHIPDGPGYQEKFYFSPGDTGFKTFDTAYGKIGIGICWDQWFPETARALALQGAEIIFYPTAIGSEPENPDYNSSGHWMRAMMGHSACNMVPVVISNRIGTETFAKSNITFYGNSFITDCTGALLQHANPTEETILVQTFDLNDYRRQRHQWGLFRDRVPSLYSVLLTKDGKL